ncbi:MAG: DUF4261 domain-containing protein [Armatimonadota bacterium]|nr:DUF4261 domain-containing protein [Armatimonadota bacterium]
MDLSVIIIIAVIAAAAVALTLPWLRRRQEKPSPSHYSPVDLCVFLKEPVKINPGTLAEIFGQRWGARALCRESAEWSDAGRKLRAYLLTDGTASLLLLISDLPAPDHLTKPVLESLSIAPDRKPGFSNHKAAILIRCVTPSDEGAGPAVLCAKGLLTLLSLPQAIGYVDVSARLYRAKEALGRMLQSTSVDNADLFAMLVNMHAVTTSGGRWLHTHGMEQFGLPDVEVTFESLEKATYYQALLTNAALYMIEQGPVLNVGDTAALAGDGQMYRIRPGAAEPRHPYGRRGVIEIVEC